jgi:hypothetical protein
MAMVNFEQGRYDEAEVLLQKSLDIAKKAFGAQHVKVAQCMSDLGMLHIKKRNFTEAEAGKSSVTYFIRYGVVT